VTTIQASKLNTLQYDSELCCGCGMCLSVCPHGVFGTNGAVPGSQRSEVAVVRGDACIECGACQRNCPTGAIEVESGVGCAAAMIYSALTGRKEECGSEGCCS